VKNSKRQNSLFSEKLIIENENFYGHLQGFMMLEERGLEETMKYFKDGVRG
jgi:hypothetical protein